MQHLCEMLDAIHLRIQHLEAGGEFIDLSEDPHEPGRAPGGASVSIDLVSDDDEQPHRAPTLAEILEAVRPLQGKYQITPQLSGDQLLLSYGDHTSGSTTTIQEGKIIHVFFDETTEDVTNTTFANTEDLMVTVCRRAAQHMATAGAGGSSAGRQPQGSGGGGGGGASNGPVKRPAAGGGGGGDNKKEKLFRRYVS